MEGQLDSVEGSRGKFEFRCKFFYIYLFKVLSPDDINDIKYHNIKISNFYPFSNPYDSY